MEQEEGSFQRAIRELANRQMAEMQRREERAILWSGRGWELPEDGWRQAFRGEGGGARD